jgi:hypothetical protein
MALRTAHKSGKYWRDLSTTNLLNISTATAVQQVALTDAAGFRQVATLKYKDEDRYLNSVAVDDLVDLDGYVRSDVYWGMGAYLNIRAYSPVSAYTLTYYRWPSTTDASTVFSWILDDHEDLIVLLAASTVLGMLGEQEIKSRVDQLAGLAMADLQQDGLEIYGR